MDGGYEIGTVASGRFVERGCHLQVWLDCPDCHYERWVELSNLHKQEVLGRCQLCFLKSQEHSNAWRGGRMRDAKHGYIFIWVYKDDFFFSMVSHDKGVGGYVAEHRLVMAKHLNRCLLSWEVVHHKNRVKDDNRLINLQLVGEGRHQQLTLLENKIRRLETKVDELQRDIRLLKWQRKQDALVVKDA